MKGDDVKNNKRVSTWFIVMLIVATGGFFIWVENPLIHISTMEKKLNASLIVAGICITILLFDDAIVRLWQMIISRSYFQRFNLLSGLSNSGRKSKKAIKNSRAEILNHVLTYLRQSYGRRWRAKTRILLVMGDAPQVDQLVPKLTSQRWVEGDGVVLIWGGTLTETPDASLFDAIRKLHRRPLDGIVWVTPTFQHQDTLVQSAPVVSLTAEQIDNAARHLQAVFTTLRWRVPLYLWSLYGAQFVRDDVTLHSATCLFPAGCTTALCRSQLTSLAMQMAEQGTQQVTRNIRDNFLLKMANLLMPGAEAISESLSTFFSPHRPLPLAAVILSQYAENTSSHVAHA